MAENTGRLLFSFLAAAMLLAAAIPARAGEYTAAAIGEDEQFALVAARILDEAYARAGHQLKILYLPGRRSLLESNAGRVDGELVRLPVIEAEYPNLLRVDVPIVTIILYAYSRDPSAEKIHIWGDLSRYRVAMRRGVKLLEKMVQAPAIILVDNSEQLFSMLDRGRADIVITNDLTINMLHRKDLYRSKALYTQPAYHYIHKSHPNLVPEIAANLRAMQADGTKAVILEEVAAGAGM